jgi:hypothetical protein
MIIVYVRMKVTDTECVCENGSSPCVETHKRLSWFKKTHDREFSNVRCIVTYDNRSMKVAVQGPDFMTHPLHKVHCAL